jgi:hypothetical protein
MPDDYFGPGVAEDYDDSVAERFDRAELDATVDFLAALAGDGPAVEFGIGTGRVALPLTARGVPVHGVDLSTAMLDQLRAKPGADRIALTTGDFARVSVPGSFALVYLVFNTIMNLTSQQEQVACFRNAAAHLHSGGCFVVEVGVPALRRLPVGETIQPFTVTPTRLGFDEYDVATQRLVSHHFRLVDGAWQQRSIPFRYVWPAELDLMAQLAGLTLRERWSGWRREPFTSDSERHVSVWEKPAAP